MHISKPIISQDVVFPWNSKHQETFINAARFEITKVSYALALRGFHFGETAIVIFPKNFKKTQNISWLSQATSLAHFPIFRVSIFQVGNNYLQEQPSRSHL